MIVFFSSHGFVLGFMLQSYHERGVGLYKVFSSNDLTLLFYSIFALFFTQEETTMNITVHILNYNGSFLQTN